MGLAAIASQVELFMFHWVVDPGAEGAGAAFAAFEEHQPQAHLIAELAPLDFPSTGLLVSRLQRHLRRAAIGPAAQACQRPAFRHRRQGIGASPIGRARTVGAYGFRDLSEVCCSNTAAASAATSPSSLSVPERREGRDSPSRRAVRSALNESGTERARRLHMRNGKDRKSHRIENAHLRSSLILQHNTSRNRSPDGGNRRSVSRIRNMHSSSAFHES